MIRNLLRIFIPDQLKNYVVLPLKSVGLFIDEQTITATVALTKGKKVFIQQTFTVDLTLENDPMPEKISKALVKIFKEIGSYNKLTSVVSSSMATFKELTFPFVSKEKIEPTLAYKLESVLPFPLYDLNIDFIITHHNESNTESSVVACAIQTKWINDHVEFLKSKNIEPSTVTLDAIALYGIYSYFATTAAETVCTVLLDVRQTQTTIIILEGEKLSYVRTIPAAKQNTSAALLQEIERTLSSYLDNNLLIDTIDTIVLFNDNYLLKEKLETQFSVKTSLFSLKEYPEYNTTFMVPETIKSIDMVSVAAALSLLKTSDFDINTKLTHSAENSLVHRQMIVGAVLALSILATLATHAFMQISKLSHSYEMAKTEVINTLKKEFPTIDSNNITDLLARAQKEVKTEEGIWSSFSTKTRQSYLEYLFVLSTKIDREGLGLVINKMLISKKSITLGGRVKDYAAIGQFQKQLNDTELFITVPDLQKTDFDGVSLPLKQPGVSA